MWTSTLELNPRRVLITQLLGRFWQGAYFSSFAPLQVQNLPRQPLKAANWVRVRNHLAGISGNDLQLIYLDEDFRIAPAAMPQNNVSYPGREVVGEVIEVGDEVQHLQVGDRVVLQGGLNCRNAGMQPPCRSCASGNFNLCEYATFPGPLPVGGGWSEEMLLHEEQLFRISSALSNEQAVLLEPTAVALHAILRQQPPLTGDVLIIGAGTVGLLTLQVLRALFPQTKISVMIRHAFQVEQALRMGADYILYPQDSYEEVQYKTGAHLYKGFLGNKMLLGGYDVIYDTISSKRTLHDALRWARAGGTVVLVGMSLHLMNIDLSPIWYQEINLIGSLAHGTETWPIGSTSRQSTFAIASELIENAKIHPESLVTHRFALNNYQQALVTATGKDQSRAIKVLFDYSLLPATVVPNVRASARQHRPILQRQTQSSAPAEHILSPMSMPPAIPVAAMQSEENAENVDSLPTHDKHQSKLPSNKDNQAHPLIIPENSDEAVTIEEPLHTSTSTPDSAEEDMATVVMQNPKYVQSYSESELQNSDAEPTPFATPEHEAPFIDENATVVVSKPKYNRKSRKTQTGEQFTQEKQPLIKAGGSDSLATNGTSDTFSEVGEQSNNDNA